MGGNVVGSTIRVEEKMARPFEGMLAARTELAQ
jgi:hypothetical protein